MTNSGGHSSHIGRDNYGLSVTGDGNFIFFGSDRGNHVNDGLRHLRLGMYSSAVEDFRLAMSRDAENPDAYFLGAVAALDGKKAFLASLACIREVERMIGAAIRLENRGLFHYFLAYVRYDYYERKFLRPPETWRASLIRARSLGLEPDAVASLFRLLSVADPLQM